jgi:Histidine kinase-, DNA gyrase B-, and HSP90-like ATPase
MAISDVTISPDLLAQRHYTEKIDHDFGLTIAGAFVRGIRDIGYKDTATALYEDIDNSIQAEATKVLVTFGYGPGSDAKPESIAIVDNGHGMDPEMVRLSVIWGGTHRENDRTGFGRYGYGLPSSCVSQGRSFTVFSHVEGAELQSVTLDLDDITDGKLSDGSGRIVVPKAKPAELPKWLSKEIRERFGSDGFSHGTVVLIEKLDELTWVTKSALERNLLQGIGTTYRKFLRNTTIWVGKAKVEPIDPLFITPGYRFYDLDNDRAEALEPSSIEVRDRATSKSAGTIKVRYSSMPPTFARVDKTVERGKNNARFTILDRHNGIIVLREGRQIDVVTKGGWLNTNNDDRYWGVEIDMPATLDKEMAITTSKQRIILSERIWELLDQHGVRANVIALRKRYDEEKAKLRTVREQQTEAARVSEQAMAATDKFEDQRTPDTPERRQRSQESFEREVERRSSESGVPREQVTEQLKKETQERPYKLQTESMPGAPFFRMGQIGDQKVLYLNTAHRFYRDVYAGPDSNARMRAGLEVVLFAIGSGEMNAEGELLTFYETERSRWSLRLNTALTQMANIDSPAEDRSGDEAEPTEE